jgi:signal transduction histidine kinase
VSRNVRKRLAKIERLVQKILERPITPPLSEEEGVEPVSANRLLRERIEQLWEHEPYRSVRHRFDFELDDAVTIKASPEWLRRVVDILVDNAVEAMIGVADKQLVISTRLVNNGVEIVFTDTGKGISKDVLPILFRERVKESKGLGMGLLMAQTILQTYGGRIDVGSYAPGDTTMIVWLPLTA